MYSKSVDFYVFDNQPLDKALARTTHLAVSAHQDDIEFMAYKGILECFGQKDKWFSAIVMTDGAGSPRSGIYADYTDSEMQAVRQVEQKKAAFVGEYGSLTLLNYPSKQIKDPNDVESVSDLAELIAKMSPEVVYTHNPADKHDTHVGAMTKVVKAIRSLPADKRPKKLYGCEVWRGLDWVNNNEKIRFDVGEHPNLAAALMGVFDSQIAGGKRYDAATIGRRTANATYADDHEVDRAEQVSYAIDLTPLIEDDTLSIADYILGYISRFADEVKTRINKVN